MGGFSNSWEAGGGTTHIRNSAIGVLQATQSVLSKVRVTGFISALVGLGHACGRDRGRVDGPAPSTNSRPVIVAHSELYGTGSGPSRHTIEVGSGGVQMWNSTVIAAQGPMGKTGRWVFAVVSGEFRTSGGKGNPLCHSTERDRREDVL